MLPLPPGPGKTSVLVFGACILLSRLLLRYGHELLCLIFHNSRMVVAMKL